MKTYPLLATALLLAGCASTSTIPESRTDRSIVSVGGGAMGNSSLQLTRDAAITSGSIPAAPNQVWAVVPTVFAQFELPVTELNPAAKIIATSNQRLRRVAGKSIANYFTCPGPYGNAAGSADVYVLVRTQVLPGTSAENSLVRTEVEATARSTTAANSTISCSTSGALEKLIMETIAAQVAAG